MEITNDMIQYVASLAKLTLTEEQKEKAKEDLGKILGYIDRMNEMDTEGMEPVSHAFPLKNVFREDVCEEEPETEEEAGARHEARELLLENAPVRKDGCFVVPKTVG